MATGAYGQSPFKVVTIDKGGAQLGPEEPSIAIHPKKPKRLVAAANVSRVYYSKNGGKAWKQVELGSPYGIYGDPCLIPGPGKSFLYFHLSFAEPGVNDNEGWLDRMVCQRSDDFGETWNEGSFTGLNPPKDQDKEWAVYDEKSGNIYLTWTQFDLYDSPDSSDRTVAMFSVSYDGGLNWQEAQRISNGSGNCLDNSGTLEGVVPTVDDQGNVYVVWMLNDSLYFTRSSDQGKTWPKREWSIGHFPGWNFNIPGIMRCNGFPQLLWDNHHGNRLYLSWSDQSNGEDNTDIWLMTSDDGGKSWSDKMLVNRGRDKGHQFFSWMTVDPVTGHLYWLYYDRSAYDDERTDVALTWSEDGGKHFQHQRISQSPFTPDDEIFFGDYIQVVAYKKHIRPIWTRLDGADELSIRTALIKHNKLGE